MGVRHSSVRRCAAMRRELPTGFRIPYSALVHEDVLRTESSAYVMGFRLGGASFDCADNNELNSWHERVHALWRTVASPHVALWTHLIRERATLSSNDRTADGFAGRVAQGYHRSLTHRVLWSNQLYLTLVYRPTMDPASGLASLLLRRPQSGVLTLEVADALDACGKLRQVILAGLDAYAPECLGAYDFQGQSCSRLLEFLGLLVNGEGQPFPLPRAPVAEVLGTSRLCFGAECVEYRTPTATRFGAFLGIKEYASPTVPGLFNGLLTAPYPFVLTQSFAFLSRASGQMLLTRQLNRLANSGDHAHSQAAGLREALDQLSSGEIGMGDHHFSLQVLSSAVPADDTAGVPDVLRRLNDHVADARARLADTGLLIAREDLGLEAAFWAQLPGCFALRPRVSPISTRNFAGMNPFHNFPSGHGAGKHWGGAVVTFPTSAGSPYEFALHVDDIGHTFLCGPTGSGKTVLVAFLIALYQRQGATQVVFDKDRGLEILVRALKGSYLPLRNGVSTGFNPLSLPLTPANIEFLRNWLRVLARPAAGVFGVGDTLRDLSVREDRDLDHALRGTMALDPLDRRLSRLIEFLDRTDPEGLHGRLSRWCASTGGEYAWVFDNPCDTVVPMMSGAGVLGFDVTEFLDHATIRTPITLYLFHLVRQLLDGRRLICWLDEFWRMLADPAFEQFAKDGPKTWRKLNGVMCLSTQSASDVLASPLSHTIVEQTATKIFFPNVDAALAEYREGFGLSARQFALIKSELTAASHQFLIKKGHDSVVCELDLSGLEAELTVFSGRATSLQRLERLMAELTEDPDRWLNAFLAEGASRPRPTAGPVPMASTL